MRTKEHLESYLYSTANELTELNSISWPENRKKLERRISSLESFIQKTIFELNLNK
ncbi:MAG: hypothetical protein K9M56_00855 [Victivallales bacterium]|nr:hypothetical protein [Victivallales bacterium]